MKKKYRFKTEPFEHQRAALGASWDKTEFAYFMEMGTGKSKVLIDNLAQFLYTPFGAMIMAESTFP